MATDPNWKLAPGPSRTPSVDISKRHGKNLGRGVPYSRIGHGSGQPYTLGVGWDPYCCGCTTKVALLLAVTLRIHAAVRHKAMTIGFKIEALSLSVVCCAQHSHGMAVGSCAWSAARLLLQHGYGQL